MANPEHLDILEKGVETWNEYFRKQLPFNEDISAALINYYHPEVDLRSARLEDLDLNGVLLPYANLSHANILSTNFAEGVFYKTDFTKAKITGGNFSSCELTGSSFKASILDLSNFTRARLTQASLENVQITNGNFKEADLTNASLKNARITKGNFINANLRGADLSGATLGFADFTNADLSDANLADAKILGGNFTSALLRQSDLSNALFFEVDLNDADLTQSRMGSTVIRNSTLCQTQFDLCFLSLTSFYNCDLSKAQGLENTLHSFPSSIGIDTVYKSAGNIPVAFLRKCGVPEDFIIYAKSLKANPIEFYSCFISFTEKDDAFSERLYNDMQAKGVRCWRWKEDAKWGRTLRKEIDEAVRYYDKLVVICSKDSLNAPAVLEEIERALDKEDVLKRKGDEGEVLFPIRIDDHIFDGWESELKVRLTKKNIGDFRNWNSDPEKYRTSVERLVRDLNRPSAAR